MVVSFFSRNMARMIAAPSQPACQPNREFAALLRGFRQRPMPIAAGLALCSGICSIFAQQVRKFPRRRDLVKARLACHGGSP
jgi:hypothetical protein